MNMQHQRITRITRCPLLALLAAGIAGCVSLPIGPTRMALPGSGRRFDEFRADDAVCRQYAQESVGITAAQAQESSAVAGTAIGAAAGSGRG